MGKWGAYVTQAPIRYVANLHSRQGIDIAISYSIVEDTFANHPRWIATDVSFGCQAKDGLLMADWDVSLVLINRYFSEDIYYQQQKVWVVPMHMADSYMGITMFSGGDIPAVDAQYAPTDFYIKCHPQAALVANGVWQIDPIQHGEQHNFNFDWMLYP